MTPEEMLARIEYASKSVRSGRRTAEECAIYLRRVVDAFMKNTDDPNDKSLKQGFAELGEAPRDWGEDEDFTERDVQEMAAGDDLDAPGDHDIDED